MGQDLPRVLVLSGKATEDQSVRKALGHCFNLSFCRDAAQILQELREGPPHHAILADTADLLPLERLLVTERASLLLEHIGEGLCLVDDRGQQVWSNQHMSGLSAAIQERVRQTCQTALQAYRQQGGNGKGQPVRSHKYGFQIGDGQYYETLITPILNTKGQAQQALAVVWDASTGRRLQQKLDAIDAAGRELVRLESENLSRLNVGERLKLLEDKIIRFCRDLMKFDHFIIRVLNKKNSKLEPVIAVGVPLEALEVDLYAQPEGNGISGYVAVTGRSYICNDVEKDSRYVIGLDHAKSSLTVPLRLHDRVIGVFDIESKKPGSFTEDDRQFASIFGRYIAMALNILDLLVVERYTTSDKIIDRITRELMAPSNDIVTEIQGILDQCQDEGIRQRLKNVLKDSEVVRATIQTLAGGPQTILGSLDDVDSGDEKHPLRGRRILVADDEAGIRDTINQMLKKLGCEVSIAKDGHEAVRLAGIGKWDLLISDIRLPHRNGYEIFSAVRRIHPNLPVILMTAFGYDPSHSIVRASQEGLHSVLFKPFKVDQLLEQVFKAMGLPALKLAKPNGPLGAATPTA